MRIDQLLNTLCLVKTRSIAKKACDKGLVRINNKQAKSSAKICENDTIEFDLFGHRTNITIKTIPKGNVSKKSAPEYYSMNFRDKLDIPES